MNSVIVISGPTASGKSSLAMDLALRLNGVIISADSMQIYRKMNIGTAKPTAEDMRLVEHKLIDILDIGESFSAADYKNAAYEEIQNALDRGKQPILAGGTGLYIDAVLNNTSFGDFECPPDIRTRLNEEAKALGAEELHRRLASVDPEAASEIHPNNLKRVVRALEVYEATGNTITYYKSISRNTPPPFTFSHFTLVCEDRERLYDRINRRVDIMIEHGLVEEAHLLYTSGFEQAVTASQAIAYKELFGYFKGEMSLEESVELLKQKTRNYAKRQLTWFSRYDAVRLEIQ
ncbi:MAG: tRNA (adenosine(37)-N6)-dimethylallyltransferase MiaA [Ruminococcaceae bacterium]|nr:tRNA (adenosine(37)-N6)-dimethylallyltransferase MiaA [Oscillospiraceae bacterium]